MSTPDEITAAVGTRLRQHRLAQLFSQRELAARAGVSLGAIRRLEGSGQVNFDALTRVAQALGLTSEFSELFAYKYNSIADLDKAEAAHSRQRAPRRTRPNS